MNCLPSKYARLRISKMRGGVSRATRSVAVRIVSSLLCLSLVYVIGIVVRQHLGIAVIVSNDSVGELREVSVKVEYKGERYLLPDIKPGQTRTVFVRPHGESTINLEFSDARGARRKEMLAGYVENGYCGRTRSRVLPDGRVEVEDDSFGSACWSSWLDLVRR